MVPIIRELKARVPYMEFKKDEYVSLRKSSNLETAVAHFLSYLSASEINKCLIF